MNWANQMICAWIIHVSTKLWIQQWLLGCLHGYFIAWNDGAKHWHVPTWFFHGQTFSIDTSRCLLQLHLPTWLFPTKVKSGYLGSNTFLLNLRHAFHISALSEDCQIFQKSGFGWASSQVLAVSCHLMPVIQFIIGLRIVKEIGSGQKQRFHERGYCKAANAMPRSSVLPCGTFAFNNIPSNCILARWPTWKLRMVYRVGDSYVLYSEYMDYCSVELTVWLASYVFH